MIYAAIVAGGTGSRMGADIPKQFLKLKNREIIVHTVAAFERSPLIDRIFVGVHSEWLDSLKDMCESAGIDMKKVTVVSGGCDRSETLLNIISAIQKSAGIGGEDVIVTHDGVRPFVTEKIISDSIDALEFSDGVTAAICSTDTVLYSEDTLYVEDVLDRKNIFRAQTPQTFRLKKLIEAYDSLSEKQRSRLTDASSVFISAGMTVGLVQGSETNIKITTPFDLKLAELILENNL